MVKAGLQHNWTVDLLHDNVIRTVRSDGLVWTFEWNDLLDRVVPFRTLNLVPPDDDYAEAMTVADLARSERAMWTAAGIGETWRCPSSGGGPIKVSDQGVCANYDPGESRLYYRYRPLIMSAWYIISVKLSKFSFGETSVY